MKRALIVAALLTSASWTARAEDPPLAVGTEGVPVPKKTKDVRPKYPPEAAAQGIRGIVILDLVIDTSGRVESTSIVRSVPGLDDAAVAAVSQWRYEPVKVDGRPARLRMTVPIAFSLALPRLAREAGIPELRQGVAPKYPEGASGGGKATVAVLLETDGRIAAKGPIAGSEEPWTGSLLAALETWRFSPMPDDSVVSFRIEAEFLAGKSEPDNVTLRAKGLKTVEAQPATAQPATAAPAAATPLPPQPAPLPPAGPEKPREPSAATSGPQAATLVAPPPSPTATAPAPGVTAPPPPPLEVISAPLPLAPPESGISLVRDVTLEPGVPELAKGRRPVPPPLARMAGATGTVEVAFSVSAAGTTVVQKVTGPDPLKKAAEQAVASWVFRRTRADRAYLLARFDYGVDRASASVRPQASPTVPSSAAAVPPPAVAGGAKQEPSQQP